MLRGPKAPPGWLAVTGRTERPVRRAPRALLAPQEGRRVRAAPQVQLALSALLVPQVLALLALLALWVPPDRAAGLVGPRARAALLALPAQPVQALLGPPVLPVLRALLGLPVLPEPG